MKKLIKIFSSLSVTAATVITLSFTSLAGTLMKDDIGFWYLNDDGSYITNNWINEDGKWYYLGEDGYAVTGIVHSGVAKYYLGKDSTMLTEGSVYTNGICYDVLPSGILIKTQKKNCWVKVEQGYIYLSESGSILRNRWIKENGVKYFIGSDGLMATGWAKINESWYYFNEYGAMMTGLLSIDNETYYLNSDGVMAENITLEIDGQEYTFDETGAAVGLVKYKQPTYIAPDELKTEKELLVAQMADKILSEIVNDSMTLTEKARAIYAWARGNIRYVGTSDKGDWVEGAYSGFRTKRGDCYTYYAVSLALLSRCGIPSIEVVRTDNHHWWNLIDCGYGWYHFDACPRSEGGVFCLLTDAEIQQHSDTIGEGSHEIDRSLYPETPKTSSPIK